MTVPTVDRGIRGGRLLLDGDRGREAVDQIDVGLLHLLEKLARVGRQRLDVAALPFGVNRVEGERRLARARQPGDDRELVPRNIDVDIAKVMNAGAAYGYPALTHLCAFFEEPETSNYTVGQVLHLGEAGYFAFRVAAAAFRIDWSRSASASRDLDAFGGDEAVRQSRDVLLVLGELALHARDHRFVARRRRREPARCRLPAALRRIQQAEITLRVAVGAVHRQRFFEELARFAETIEAERRHARQPIDRVVSHRIQPRRRIVVGELRLPELQPVPRAPVVFLARIVAGIVLQQVDEQRNGFVVALEVAQRLRAAELHLRLRVRLPQDSRGCCRTAPAHRRIARTKM